MSVHELWNETEQKGKTEGSQKAKSTFTSSPVCVVFITDNNVVSGGFCETQNKLMRNMCFKLLK